MQRSKTQRSRQTPQNAMKRWLASSYTLQCTLRLRVPALCSVIVEGRTQSRKLVTHEGQAQTWRSADKHALFREFSTTRRGSSDSGHLCDKSSKQSFASVSTRRVTSFTMLAFGPATKSSTSCCCKQAENPEARSAAQSEQSTLVCHEDTCSQGYSESVQELC